jgi:hypothetical protein
VEYSYFPEDTIYAILFKELVSTNLWNLIKTHRITGFLDFSIVWYTREHDVSETGLFPSSGKGGGEDTYSVGPLRKS